MPAIVSEADVLALYPEADASCLLPFIQMAVGLLDQHYTGSQRFEVERALAAHFAFLASQQVTAVRGFEYSVQYEPQSGEGLDASGFGKIVRALGGPALVRALEPRRRAIVERLA